MSTKKKDSQEDIPEKTGKKKKAARAETAAVIETREISTEIESKPAGRKKVQENDAEDKPLLEVQKTAKQERAACAAEGVIGKEKMSQRVMANVIPERFDMNYVEVQGTINHIWSRLDGKLNNVYASLNFPSNGVDEQKREHATILFHDGLMQGRDLTLLPKDQLAVTGWVTDVDQKETFKAFLDHCQRPELFRKYPLLQEIAAETVDRRMTCIVPIESRLVQKEEHDRVADRIEPNKVHIEGIVAGMWVYGNHKYIRLAVYDRNAPVLARQHQATSSQGVRSSRAAHYVTIQFTNGKVDGREVEFLSESSARKSGGLKKRDRVRVVGRLVRRLYRERMRTFLVRCKRLDILGRLENADTLPDHVFGTYVQSAIEAERIIQYT
jgi:hypothetical protein